MLIVRKVSRRSPRLLKGLKYLESGTGYFGLFLDASAVLDNLNRGNLSAALKSAFFLSAGSLSVFATMLGFGAKTGPIIGVAILVYALVELGAENYPAVVESLVSKKVNREICPKAITNVGVYKILAELYEDRYLKALHQADLLRKYEKMKMKKH